MKSHWRLLPPYPRDYKNLFSDEDDLTRQLLFNRALKTPEERSHFFYPDYETDILNPFLMEDLEKGALRIIKAIKKEEKIIVIGDYDPDGICGAAIFREFFKAIDYKNHEILILNRDEESYGLNKKTIADLKEKKAKVAITVDFGISNIKEAETIKNLGIDLIITDHHLPSKELPDALAVINPKRNDCRYPFKHLAGAGVAFKFVQGILQKEKFGLAKGYEKWFLDLAAISAVADLVELTGENRALVYYGLKVLKKAKRVGIVALSDLLGISLEKISEQDLAFYLSPALNANLRFGDVTLSYQLLITESKEEAGWIAGRLIEKQKDIKKKTEEKVEEVKNKYSGLKEIPAVIAESNERWLAAESGGLGYSATRLVEFFKRPVCLIAKRSDETYSASCRSDGSVNLVQLMEAAGGEKILLRFGGHPMAAGFSVKKENLEKLKEELIRAYPKVKEEMFRPEITAEKELSIEEVNFSVYEKILAFSPFGKGNPSPVFLLKEIAADKITQNGNSFKIIFKKQNGKEMSAVCWNHMLALLKEEIGRLKEGNKINLLASVEKLNFNRKIFLKIADFEIL